MLLTRDSTDHSSLCSMIWPVVFENLRMLHCLMDILKGVMRMRYVAVPWNQSVPSPASLSRLKLAWFTSSFPSCRGGPRPKSPVSVRRVVSGSAHVGRGGFWWMRRCAYRGNERERRKVCIDAVEPFALCNGIGPGGILVVERLDLRAREDRHHPGKSRGSRRLQAEAAITAVRASPPPGVVRQMPGAPNNPFFSLGRGSALSRRCPRPSLPGSFPLVD